MKRVSGWKSGIAVFGFCLLVSLIATGCGASGSFPGVIAGQTQSPYGAPTVVGNIQTDEIKESSGLSASECQDVLWTHNDAGNGPFIFAMDTKGAHLGTWNVQGAQNVDWESIASIKEASGKCSLLIGDIGDNEQTRPQVTIYKIPEPDMTPEGPASTTQKPLQTAAAEAIGFTYSTGSRNAETLLIHPKTADIYIVTKTKTGPAEVHKLKAGLGAAAVHKTEKVGDISMPGKTAGFVTGGSMSPDGSRVMLCDKDNGYEFVLADGSNDPDSIWKQQPAVINLGDRKQGEGVSYGRDGYSLYASSEKKNTPLYVIRRK